MSLEEGDADIVKNDLQVGEYGCPSVGVVGALSDDASETVCDRNLVPAMKFEGELIYVEWA